MIYVTFTMRHVGSDMSLSSKLTRLILSNHDTVYKSVLV